MSNTNNTPEERIAFWTNVLKSGKNKDGQPMSKGDKLHAEAKLAKAKDDKKNGVKEKKPFCPMNEQQKKDYGENFTPNEKKSYRRGQRNAYAHMSNVARSESRFLDDIIILNK